MAKGITAVEGEAKKVSEVVETQKLLNQLHMLYPFTQGGHTHEAGTLHHFVIFIFEDM